MKRLLIIAALLLVLFPSLAFAAEPSSPKDFYPLIQCGTEKSGIPCTPCDLFVEFDRVINFILFGVTGPIAVFMIILSGGMILLGGGNTAALTRGKELFKSTILGVVVILLSWVATTFLLQALTGGDTKWYEVSCPRYLSDIPIPKDLKVLPLNQRTQPYTPVKISENLIPLPAGATIGERIDLCPTGFLGGCGKCTKYKQLIANQAIGAAPSNVLEAIMFHESTCDIKAEHNDGPGRGTTYGLMQLNPDTAKIFTKECLKPESVGDAINGGWLMDERHAEETICMGARYINSLAGVCGTDPRNLAAGYNGGPKACAISRDCADTLSCTGQPMRAWECPWNNKAHTIENTGYNVTRQYGAYMSVCAK